MQKPTGGRSNGAIQQVICVSTEEKVEDAAPKYFVSCACF